METAAALLDSNVQEGFVDFLMSLFALVPAGFTLGLLVGLVAFGSFRLLALIRTII